MTKEKELDSHQIKMGYQGNYSESVRGDYVENKYNDCIINISQVDKKRVLDKKQDFQSFKLDYSQLKNFLSGHEWQKADEETVQLILKAVKKEKEQFLDNEDIRKIPCANLDEIDRLWRKFSNQHFGFSIQYQIWQNSGGYPEQIYCSDETFEQYTTKVGWCIKDKQNYLLRNQIRYDIDAPQGHLPFWFYCWSGGLWGCSIVFSRIGLCCK